MVPRPAISHGHLIQDFLVVELNLFCLEDSLLTKGLDYILSQETFLDEGEAGSFSSLSNLP